MSPALASTLTAFLSTAVLMVCCGRTQSSTAVYCKSDTDCSKSTSSALVGGETCHWLYDGCTVGQCMCDPVRQKRHPVNASCINARLGGDTCSDSAECPDGMFCSKNTTRCHCRHGHMTKDRQLCLRQTHKLLGHSCSTQSDVCYHKAVYGYTNNDVECSASSGRCECGKGWRRDGISCGSRRLHEHGCTEFFHCDSGAICSNRRCVCPSGYYSTPDDNKCIKVGAVRDLPIGAECDEINERLYCARRLVCHRCTDSTESAFICVRFRITALIGDQRFYSTGTKSPTSTTSLWTICSVATLVTLLQRSSVLRPCSDRSVL